jgi:hypothetical protein
LFKKRGLKFSPVPLPIAKLEFVQDYGFANKSCLSANKLGVIANKLGVIANKLDFIANKLGVIANNANF